MHTFSNCDLQVTPGVYCDRPVTVLAASATAPELWEPGSGASLGGFCSVEHARREPQPTYERAQQTYEQCLCDGMPITDVVAEGWRRVLASWPDPAFYGESLKAAS